MTNEEKAKDMTRCLWYPQKCTEDDIQNMLIEMAEWKDDKFYLILACIKVSLDKAGLDGDKFIDEIKKQWEE